MAVPAVSSRERSCCRGASGRSFPSYLRVWPRRVGLVGTPPDSNAEWHSALQTKSRDDPPPYPGTRTRDPMTLPPSKWHLHMARPRRVGLAGSWAHENAEWSSAMLGHAGIRNGICQIIHLGARGISRRGGIGPEGLEARGSRGTSFCFILLIFSSSFPF